MYGQSGNIKEWQIVPRLIKKTLVLLVKITFILGFKTYHCETNLISYYLGIVSGGYNTINVTGHTRRTLVGPLLHNSVYRITLFSKSRLGMTSEALVLYTETPKVCEFTKLSLSLSQKLRNLSLSLVSLKSISLCRWVTQYSWLLVELFTRVSVGSFQGYRWGQSLAWC